MRGIQHTTYNIQQRRGFTLIELLVVISVIGILASLLLARFGAAEKSGRDTRRKSDLNQYRIALENYAVKYNGVYPTSTYNGSAASDNGIFNPSGPLASYLGGFPDDPRNISTEGYNYYYRADATGTTWVLQGRIETESSASWQICSNGKSGRINGYSTNPDSTCDIP